MRFGGSRAPTANILPIRYEYNFFSPAFPPLTRLRWLESHQILRPILLTFSLKEKNASEIWIRLRGEDRERNSVPVNLSCGRGTGSRRRVILHPRTPRRGKRGALVKPAPPSGFHPSPPLLPASRPASSLTTSVCRRRGFTHLPNRISSARRQKEKTSESEGKRSDQSVWATWQTQ